jgi:phosphocarrier protein FPr/phosphocarrier protein
MPEGMIQPPSVSLPAALESGAPATGAEVCLPNASGLHARPAAMLAALAKKFKSDIGLLRDGEQVNAKSVVAIMGLATQRGDRLRVKASGVDAAQAIAALTAMLAEGCGEAPDQAVAPAAAPIRRAPVPAAVGHEFSGVCASPGLAVGRIVQYRRQEIQVQYQGGEPVHERGQLERVLQQAIAQLELLKSELADPLQADILRTHQELLQDPDLRTPALAGIDQGQSAGFAWRAAFVALASRFEAAASDLLRERANDIRDVGQRVLLLLAGSGPGRIELPAHAILIAEELTPSDTVSLDRSKLLGFCTSSGGATSHVAILARSFGIPAICGIDGRALALENGTLAVLDASRARLNGRPTEAEVMQARERLSARSTRAQEEKVEASASAVTRDGQRIEVVANVRNAQEAQQAVAQGAEGVGLLRSEFLFEERATAPSEDEQAVAYQAVAQALGAQRTLVVRTLDVGGDKPLPYLILPREDNPFLGLRGVRVSLEQPEMFRTQLRAILRAAGQARLHIMFPMIATVEELRQAKAMLAQEQAATGAPAIPVGVMIEVPSAALMASQLAREADFFSIGSNDLTQYTLAMDRGHPKLASQADALHPAVLKMMAMACDGAREHGKWVGLCGALASEPMAVPLLIGLGVTELSVSVPAIAAIKALVRRLSLAECQVLAREVLAMSSAAEVRERLADWDLE